MSELEKIIQCYAKESLANEIKKGNGSDFGYLKQGCDKCSGFDISCVIFQDIQNIYLRRMKA